MRHGWSETARLRGTGSRCCRHDAVCLEPEALSSPRRLCTWLLLSAGTRPGPSVNGNDAELRAGRRRPFAPVPRAQYDASGAMIEPEQPLIHPAREVDLEALCVIASASFATPWGRDTFVEELSRPWAHLRVLRPSADAPPAAFISSWLVRDEVHVLNIATHPSARRRGYARLLMEEALTLAGAHLVRYVTLEARRSNTPALRLYRSLGFQSIGVRPGYYTDTQEDAIVMVRVLG